MAYGSHMSSPTVEPKALHIDNFPPDLRAGLDRITADNSFHLRVTVIQLLRESVAAYEARQAASVVPQGKYEVEPSFRTHADHDNTPNCRARDCYERYCETMTGYTVLPYEEWCK